MRISIDFYIKSDRYLEKRSEVFVVAENFNGPEDAVKVANIYMKKLKRGLRKNEYVSKVVFDDLDITPYVNIQKLHLVK